MKTFNLFAMLFIAVMLFTSCKKEEEGTPRQITKTYTYTQNIRGTMGVKGELPSGALTLADIIGIEPAKNFQYAEMQLANSKLEISGLSDMASDLEEVIVLEDFTIKVGSRPGVNLGDCSTDPQGINEFAADTQQSTNEIVNLINDIFSDVTSGSKSSTITISFTPNVDIATAENIQLKISIGGTYHYEEFL